MEKLVKMDKLVKIKKTVRLPEATYNQLREYMVPRGVMRHIDIINILKKSSAAAAHKIFSDEVFEKIARTMDADDCTPNDQFNKVNLIAIVAKAINAGDGSINVKKFEKLSPFHVFGFFEVLQKIHRK